MRAEAAADLAALLAEGLLNTLDAAVAALALVTSELRTCVNAEAAADLAALLAEGLLSVREAAEAAALPVLSLLLVAMVASPSKCELDGRA